MAKTMKERWLDSFPPNAEVWTLEHNKKADVTLYQTKEHRPIGFDGHIRSPVYHVWQGNDKWLIATTDYKAAYNKYTSVLK